MNGAPIVIDVETVPLAESLLAPYPEATRQPPANYKSEEAITKWRDADRASWAEARVKECSLNPRLGRLVVFGSSAGVLTAPTEQDEPALLEAAWALIRGAAGRVVTWNGTFDLRFLLIRSLAHGIRPGVRAEVIRQWFARYHTYPHFDCKAVLLNWDVKIAGEGLNEWGAFFGLEGKTGGLTGKDVWPLYQAGDVAGIARYCEGDVALTQAIYDKIHHYFG